MKVMWNIRLFKGMQLLPRQVSDGDRRMDVYVKMVLIDNGQPKSYAIKVNPLDTIDIVTQSHHDGSIILCNTTSNSNSIAQTLNHRQGKKVREVYIHTTIFSQTVQQKHEKPHIQKLLYSLHNPYVLLLMI